MSKHNQVREFDGYEGFCTDCPNRPLCTALCPEAEVFANQDQPKEGPQPIEPPHFSPTEQKILIFLVKKIPTKEAIKVLRINKNTYHVHLHNLRKKLFRLTQ